MVRFFVYETAPEEFYEKILTEAIPLFESGLVLSNSNFLQVLQAYEKVSNKVIRKKDPLPTFVEKMSGVLAHCASLSLSIKI